MKKHLQLGMNPSTANGRLVKDLLFSFVEANGHVCFRCGEKLSRENFSIDHKKPWLDSGDPKKLFFDQTNIAYSHLVCNIKAGRKNPPTKYTSKEEAKTAQRAQQKAWTSKTYTPEARHARYVKTGR